MENKSNNPEYIIGVDPYDKGDFKEGKMIVFKKNDKENIIENIDLTLSKDIQEYLDKIQELQKYYNSKLGIPKQRT